ncbi:globin domain-containing protein [Pseudoruegeria sp. HB172150]|uniref:globin domain-containing protein n=1 Tax=Pseudoruegeria sp. HB172150 TaxID=2721164 RepID=UPI001555F8D1|nr:globin domain-containing protein [Pseudoruegeria sp. HB172150]
MLDDTQKLRIRTGFANMKIATPQFAREFYARLFDLAPEVRPLFEDDITAQAVKLQKTLALVVQMLDNLEALVPALGDLGRRHAGYGAVEAHYGVVAQALLETLAEQVPNWSETDMAAWSELYSIAAGAMLDGARDATSPRTVAG